MDHQALETKDETRSPLDEISIRGRLAGDEPFIFSSWLRSYRDSKFAKRIRKDVYFYWHQKIVERILEKPNAIVFLACLKDSPEVILGYLVAEAFDGKPKVVHYCFVKENFRRHGIARLLVNSLGNPGPLFFSHWTYALDPIFDQNQETLIYDPYRI